MKRYYVCRKVGTGTDEDPIRLKAMDYPNASVSGVLAGTRNWGLAIVAAADHTEIIADPDCYPLPDLSLDARLNTLTTAQRTALLTRLTQIDLPVTVTATDAYRILIRQVGQLIASSAFDENRFDAHEPN